MKIAIAALTWNRLGAIKQFIDAAHKHCAKHQLAVFEDAGTLDDTRRHLAIGETYIERRDLAAIECANGVFLGTRNLGVAGNSNRAVRWFMKHTDADYLCLCNDDLIIKGDFAALYADAWQETKVGLFCYCGFTSSQYAWTPLKVGKYTLKDLSRMTGAMLAFPRELITRIGYFDTKFGKFGEEHCHFTDRARLAGFQHASGKDRYCLDVEHDLLGHLDVASTMAGEAKENADLIASSVMRGVNFTNEGLYVPYKLDVPYRAGGVHEVGISTQVLSGYYDVGCRHAIGSLD